MDNIINNSYDLPFGESIIKKSLPGVQVILYEDLKHMRSVDDLFDQSNAIVILYQIKQKIGHWVCLLRKKRHIEFFDSYGLSPDEQLKYARFNRTPYLSELLRGRKVIYNKMPLQEEGYNMSTCGRWVVMRILMSFMSLEEFLKLFTNQTFIPDYYVTILTLFFV